MMAKKKINIKRVDGVTQGYHVNSIAKSSPSFLDIPKLGNGLTSYPSSAVDRTESLYASFMNSRSEVEDENPVLEWNDDVAMSVVNSMPNINHTVPGLLANKLYLLSKQNNIHINYDHFSPQALASQMGNVLESVYEHNFNIVHAADDRMLYVKGGDLGRKIKEIRKSEDLNKIENFKKELKNVLMFTDAYVDRVMVPGVPVHLPDAIVVDRRGEVVKVKCAEIKASGMNDSSSVPENIDKMAHGTRNSAVEPYKGRNDVELERAVVIAATVADSRGNFTAKNAWVNAINQRRRKVGDVKVFCNEEAFSWLSGVELSAEQYDKDFINTTAYAQLKRIENSS